MTATISTWFVRWTSSQVRVAGAGSFILLAALLGLPTAGGQEEVTIKSHDPEDLRILAAMDHLLLKLSAAGDKSAATLRARIPAIRNRVLVRMRDADGLLQAPLTRADLSRVRNHNSAVRDASVVLADFMSDARLHIRASLKQAGLDPDAADGLIALQLADLVKPRWHGRPNPGVAAAIEAVLDHPALPTALKKAFSAGTIELEWSANTSRDLSNTVAVRTATSLKVGRQFEALSPEAQLELFAFEVGKLLYIQPGNEELLKAFRRFPIPASVRQLPNVPILTDDDFPSHFGYAYAHFLLSPSVLRKNGLDGLVDEWNKRPPQAFLLGKSK